MARYRIVTDNFLGFEVQKWVWWFPIWREPITNTHSTVEKAKVWLANYVISNKYA
jgi:hypothetical protein